MHPHGFADAYNRAVSTADAADVKFSTSKTVSNSSSNVRVNDFVNRGPDFDSIYIFGPLLAACNRIIGRPFKLSSMHARTLNPGAPAGGLHVDVKREADGWPLVSFILMVDEFHSENGATRFVPGSHLLPREPASLLDDPAATYPGEVLACGPPGSMLIFTGSVWHGFTANRTASGWRSIQGAFIPREATAATNWTARMRPETLQRIGDRAKHLLDLGREK